MPTDVHYFRHWIDQNYSEGELIKIFIQQPPAVVEEEVENVEATHRNTWLLKVFKLDYKLVYLGVIISFFKFEKVQQDTLNVLKKGGREIKVYLDRITKQQVNLTVGIIIIISAVSLFTFLLMNFNS